MSDSCYERADLWLAEYSKYLMQPESYQRSVALILVASYLNTILYIEMDAADRAAFMDTE